MITRLRVTWDIESLGDLLKTDVERVRDERFGDGLVLRIGGRGHFSPSFWSFLIHTRRRNWAYVRGQTFTVPVKFIQVGPFEWQRLVPEGQHWRPHERPLTQKGWRR